jgi:hypothetical protein
MDGFVVFSGNAYGPFRLPKAAQFVSWGPASSVDGAGAVLDAGGNVLSYADAPRY